MSVKKCTSQEASHYINDLFETLEMKGNNQLLFNEFCQLLMKYSLETVKKSWKEIVFSCDLPNGQIAGRLPKMQMIEKILFNTNDEDEVNFIDMNIVSMTIRFSIKPYNKIQTLALPLL